MDGKENDVGATACSFIVSVGDLTEVVCIEAWNGANN